MRGAPFCVLKEFDSNWGILTLAGEEESLGRGATQPNRKVKGIAATQSRKQSTTTENFL
jgi:hypothetical protein